MQSFGVLGFGVNGLGLRVEGLEFGVWGEGCRVEGEGCSGCLPANDFVEEDPVECIHLVERFGFRVQGSGFRV